MNQTISHSPRRRALLAGQALFILLLLAAPARPASARAEVFRLIPEDVGFCLVIQDLRKEVDALRDSPFAEAFLAAPLCQSLRKSPEMRKLESAQKLLHEHLNLTWAQLRDDFLGDTVVLAYRLPPPGKPDQEQGVILLRARDAKVLADLVERLNKHQKESGEIKDVEVRKHNGISYYHRQGPNGDQFYYLHGPILAFTAQEEMLRQVIDRGRQEAKTEPFLTRQLRRLGAAEALAVLWINPRAFDAEFERKAAGARGGEIVVLKRILALWQAVEGIALSASIQKNQVETALAFTSRDGEMSTAARKFFTPSATSELWGRFSENALLSAAGRLDGTSLSDFAGEFLPENAQRSLRDALERGAGPALGLDVNKDLLPNIGPDWGVTVLAPAPGEKTAVPLAFAALRVRAGSKDRPVDRALLNALNSLATLAVLAYNRSHPDPLSLKTVVEDGVEVRYLFHEKLFVPGVQPAFALRDGYLVLASSPAAVKRFRSAAVEPTPATADVPVLRMSLRDLGAYFKEHQNALVTHLAAKHQLSDVEIRRRLNGIASLCQLFDRLDLVERVTPERMTLLLQWRAAQPLRK